MAQNIEIKARIKDLRPLLDRVKAAATDGPVIIFQDDTFFGCIEGRLKLREFNHAHGELINTCFVDNFYEGWSLRNPSIIVEFFSCVKIGLH